MKISLRRLCIAPAVVIIAIMLLPVIVVVSISFGASPNYQFPPTSLSLRWFVAFFSNPTFRDALLNVSLPLGIGVAAMSSVLGTLAAIGLSRSRLRGRQAVELLFISPVIFPQILLAVGLFMVYAQLNLTPSLLTLGLAHVLIGTPFVIRTVQAGLSAADRQLEEAAQNLGASPLRAFWLTTLPALRPSIAAGATFAFIASFSDINLALFLATADFATLPVQILAQTEYSNDPTIAAAATVQVAVVSVLLLLTQRFAGRGAK